MKVYESLVIPVKVGFFYSAMPRPAALYNCRKWQLIGKSQWCSSANCGHPLLLLLL